MGQSMKPGTRMSLSHQQHRPGNIRLGLGLTDSWAVQSAEAPRRIAGERLVFLTNAPKVNRNFICLLRDFLYACASVCVVQFVKELLNSTHCIFSYRLEFLQTQI